MSINNRADLTFKGGIVADSGLSNVTLLLPDSRVL